MKAHAAFVYLFVSVALVGAHAATVTRTGISKGPKNAAQTATPVFPASPVESAGGPLATPHLFPVNDERGLLLTCIAPEIETNHDTDLFNNCTLAPGRTLDDVMHTFVRALHYQQHQQDKDNAESQKDSEQKTAQSSR
jgi:hypothetical protein